MKRKFLAALAVVSAIAVVIACSKGGGDSVTAPSRIEAPQPAASVGNVTRGSVGPNISSYNMVMADVQVGLHSHRLHQGVAGWKKLAKRLSKDIAVWLEANREPIAKHQEMRRELRAATCGDPSNTFRMKWCGE